MTAYAMKGDRDRCLQAGMDAYLSKPINACELQSLVEGLATEVGGNTISATTTDGFAARPAEDFDFSDALDRLEGDVEIFKEQIEFFLYDSPRLLTSIRSAIADSDAQGLHIAAHRLKGLASNFDAHEVVETASKLEQAGRENDLGKSAEHCRELEELINTLVVALKQFLKHH
jgi:HPt (histidine-containing phosphotransfer) domain-containing protein